VADKVVSLDSRRPRPLHMMTPAQRDEAGAAIRQARKTRDQAISRAYLEFNSTLRAYAEVDVPIAEIAVEAGLTRQRVYQIVAGK
jgi:hypothetical protein